MNPLKWNTSWIWAALGIVATLPTAWQTYGTTIVAVVSFIAKAAQEIVAWHNSKPQPDPSPVVKPLAKAATSGQPSPHKNRK